MVPGGTNQANNSCDVRTRRTPLCSAVEGRCRYTGLSELVRTSHVTGKGRALRTRQGGSEGHLGAVSDDQIRSGPEQTPVPIGTCRTTRVGIVNMPSGTRRGGVGPDRRRDEGCGDAEEDEEEKEEDDDDDDDEVAAVAIFWIAVSYFSEIPDAFRRW